GNGAAWVWTILFIFGIVSIAIVTLYAAGAMNALFMVIVGAVLTIIPLVINSHKNEQWLKDAKAYEESQK
ncbi:hypothetical protein NE602_27230, partial [Bacteroides cellulosilyticus]